MILLEYPVRFFNFALQEKTRKNNNMKLHFSIDYHTQWGQQIGVILRAHTQQGRVHESIVLLDTADGHQWKGDHMLSLPGVLWFEYIYMVYASGRIIRREWKYAWRKFRWDASKEFILPDRWQAVPSCAHLYSSAFGVVRNQTSVAPSGTYFTRTLRFRVHIPTLHPNEQPAILGSIPVVGSWQPEKALPLEPVGLHEWGIALSAEGMQFPFEYKYVLLDKATGAVLHWEEGDNRTTQFKGLERDQILAYQDGMARFPFTRTKAAGVVIPLFSIRTEHSWGVGDFGDLMRMTDWAESVGMKAIQLLPIYDTNTSGSWGDSYPYSCNSVYALHLQYLDMNRLPRLADEEKMQDYLKRAGELNLMPQLDYEAVYRLKSAFIADSFAQNGAEVLGTPEFDAYFKENAFWLRPYAAYIYLRTQKGTADFNQWGEYAIYHAQNVMQLLDMEPEAAQSAQLTYYTQFLLYRQMKEAHEHAHQKGILLKGDIPIGVCPHAVDVWMEPHFFHRDGQAGAPPDAFSANGQNWGFPTYNWDAIIEDGCRWWTRRLEKMAEFFDAYRIDHVLGFFRIWEIPSHAVHGLLGYFTPALPLTVQEIEKFGMEFRKDYFTRPYIADWVLEELFGEQKQLVKRKFLNALGYDWYEMKPEFATQKQIQAFFGRCRSSALRDRLRDGLYELISNVLFIEDPRQPEHYHPRITGAQSFVFQTLTQREKDAFARLYEEFYYHRHNAFWYEQAMKKLPQMADATDMLPCAEDLGMVPECVGWVLKELQILTLEIQSMPKGMNGRFAHLEENPYHSVATIFTHDMPTLRLWWKEDPETTAQYYHEILQKDGEPPAGIPGWLCEEIIGRHLFSPSMLCLISWQDWMSMDDRLRNPDEESERINVPANPHHYWRYRMHLTVEQLQQEQALNEKIRTLIHRSGRSEWGN